MTCGHDGLVRLSIANAQHGLVQSMYARTAGSVDAEAGTAKVEVVRDTTSLYGLLVPRGIEHGRLLWVAQRAQAVV